MCDNKERIQLARKRRPNTSSFNNSQYKTDSASRLKEEYELYLQYEKEMKDSTMVNDTDLWYNDPILPITEQLESEKVEGEEKNANQGNQTPQIPQLEKEEPKKKEISEELLPKGYADAYFKGGEGYSWTALQELFKSEGGGKENERIKQFLIANCLSWNEIVEEFEVNHGRNHVQMIKIGETILIEAPTIGLAFNVMRNITQVNSGVTFFYTDGDITPYEISLHIDTTPTKDQKSEASKFLFAGLDLYVPDKTLVPVNHTKTNQDIDENASETAMVYSYVSKKYEAKIDSLATYSKDHPNSLYATEVDSLVTGFNNDTTNTDFIKENDPTDGQIGGAFFHLSVGNLQEQIFEESEKNIPEGQNVLGGMQFFMDLKKAKTNYVQPKVDKETNRLYNEYLALHKEEVAVFMKPYTLTYQQKSTSAYEKINSIKDPVKKEQIKKAFIDELVVLEGKIKAKASYEFQKTDLGKKIKDQVQNDLQSLYEFAQKPQLISFASDGLKDGELTAKIFQISKDFSGSIPVKNKDGKYKVPDNAKYKTYQAKNSALKSRYENEIFPILKKKGYSQDIIDRVYVEYYYMFTKKFLFNKDGTTSAYAFMMWAEEMKLKLGAISDELFKAIEAYEKAGGRSMEYSESKIYQDALVNLKISLGMAMSNVNHVLEYPEQSEGKFNDLVGGFTSLDKHQYVPFLGTIIDIGSILYMREVTNKMEAGLPISVADDYMLQSLSSLAQLRQITETPFMHDVGIGLAHTSVTVVEFMASSGPAGLAEKAIEKSVEKAVAKSVKRTIIKKIIIKSASLGGNAMVRTFLQPLQISEKFFSRGMDNVSLQLEEDGSYTAVVTEGENVKEGTGEKIARSFLSTYVTNFTEVGGGEATKKIFKYSYKAISATVPFRASSIAFTKMLLKSKAVLTNYKFFDKLLSKSGQVPGKFSKLFSMTNETLKKQIGFDGVMGEYSEEFYEQFLQAAIEGKLPKMSLRDQAQVFTTVVISGGSLKTLQTSFVAFKYFTTFDYEGKRVRIPAEVINLFNNYDKTSFNSDLDALLENKTITQDQHALSEKIVPEIEGYHTLVDESQSHMIDDLFTENGDLQLTYEFYNKLHEELKLSEEKLIAGETNVYHSTHHKGMGLEVFLNDLNKTRLFLHEVERMIISLETKAQENNVSLHPFIPEAEVNEFADEVVIELQINQDLDFQTFFQNLRTDLKAKVQHFIETFKRWFTDIKQLYKDYLVAMGFSQNKSVMPDLTEGSSVKKKLKFVVNDFHVIKTDDGEWVVPKKAFDLKGLELYLSELFPNEDVALVEEFINLLDTKETFFLMFIPDVRSANINSSPAEKMSVFDSTAKKPFVVINSSATIFIIKKTIYHEVGHRLHSSDTHGKLVDKHVKEQFAIARSFIYDEVDGKMVLNADKAKYLNDTLIEIERGIVLDKKIAETDLEKQALNDQNKLLLGLFDTLAALTKGKYGKGHSAKKVKVKMAGGKSKTILVPYWVQDKPRKEFFAHALEIRYMKNDIQKLLNRATDGEGKKLLEDLVKLMDQGFNPMIDKIVRKNKRK